MIKRRKALWLLLLLDGALLVLACLVRPLASWMLDAWPDCYIAQRGMLCPSCGGTRAVAALCRGDVVAAWGFNAFVVLLAVYMLVLLVALHLEVLFRRNGARVLRARMTDYRTVILLGAAFGLFGILRNCF